LTWSLDGRLLFGGRVDDQIQLRGFRIEPGEIEAAASQVDGLSEIAVVVRSRDSARESEPSRTPQQLVAFVRPVPGAAAFDVEPLRRHLGQQLPSHMVPTRFVVVDDLPRLPNGKVDRERLRTMTVEQEPAAGKQAMAGAESDLEQALVALWQGLLGYGPIGPHDNFFELGGHSLLVVEMALAIERDHGVILAPSEIFQHPTVRQLATCIEAQRPAGASGNVHLFPIQPIGNQDPFVMSIPHFFTGTLAQRFRGERPVYGLRGVGLRPEGNRGRWPTMTDLANEMVEEILARFPGEALYLGGYSFGASMAVETARLLEQRGVVVRHLYLIAPMALDSYRLGPLSLQLDGLRRPVGEIGAIEAVRWFVRDNHPLTRQFYQRISRLLVQQPWRRFLCAIGRLRRWLGLPLTEGILFADVRLERFRLHHGYRPQPQSTATTIFNPIESDTDAAATWRPWFTGPFTVVPTPDPHLGEEAVLQAEAVILDCWQQLATQGDVA
jgi:acyl carrier protein/pimeloyl-ACP methyl ester carboxylesterase